MSNKITSTTETQKVTITLEQLEETLNKLQPDIIAMKYKLFSVIHSQVLPDNTIIVSWDFAEKMGWLDEKGASDERRR